MYKKLRDLIPDDCAIIAPNGPFVVPVKKREKFSAGYAWYFFDSYEKKFYINYEPGAEFVKSLLIELDLIKKPITIIGYSQGGYLAPKVAEIIPSVDTVVGLACIYRSERFRLRSQVMYHQINSKTDLVVDYEDAQSEFQQMRSKGNIGQFVTLEENGHRLDDDYLSELETFI